MRVEPSSGFSINLSELVAASFVAFEFDPDQPRDEAGKWTKEGGGSTGGGPVTKEELQKARAVGDHILGLDVAPLMQDRQRAKHDIARALAEDMKSDTQAMVRSGDDGDRLADRWQSARDHPDEWIVLAEPGRNDVPPGILSMDQLSPAEREEVRTEGTFNGRALTSPDDPAVEQQMREYAASNLVSTWMQTANDSFHRALAIQEVARQEFGLHGAAAWPMTESMDGQVGRTVNEHGDVYRDFLRTQYDHTQELLKEKGVTEVTLSRGFQWDDPKAIPDWAMQRPGEATIETRPLSAWSSNPATAEHFAGFSGQVNRELTAVVHERVPAERIVATPRTGFGSLDEYEFIVLGGRDRVTIGRAASPPSRVGTGGPSENETRNEDWLRTFTWNLPTTKEECDAVGLDLAKIAKLPAGEAMPANLKALVAAADWDEDEHPRDDHGRFAPKEGGGSSETGSKLPKGWKEAPVARSRELLKERLRGQGATDAEADAVIATVLLERDEYALYEGPNNSLIMFERGFDPRTFEGTKDVSAEDRARTMEMVGRLQAQAPVDNFVLDIDDRAFDLISERMGVPPDSMPRNTYALTVPGGGLITLNPAVYTEQNRVEFQAGAREGRFPNSARGHDIIEYTLAHEWGHMLDSVPKEIGPLKWRYEKSDTVRFEWLDHTRDEYGGYPPATSNYAKTNAQEAFAEAHADWVITNGTSTNEQTKFYADYEGWDERARTASVVAFEWNEEDHPRDADGKFAPVEGGDGAPTERYLPRLSEDAGSDPNATAKALDLAEKYNPADPYGHYDDFAMYSEAFYDSEIGDRRPPPEEWQSGTPEALSESATVWQRSFEESREIQIAADALLGYSSDVYPFLGGESGYDEQSAAMARELLSAMAGYGPDGAASAFTAVSEYGETGTPMGVYQYSPGELVRGVDDVNGDLTEAFQNAHDTGGTVSWSIASFVVGGDQGRERMDSYARDTGEDVPEIMDPETGETYYQDPNDNAADVALDFASGGHGFGGESGAGGYSPMIIRASGSGLSIDGNNEVIMGGTFRVDSIRDATPEERLNWRAEEKHDFGPSSRITVVDLHQVEQVTLPNGVAVTTSEAVAAAAKKPTSTYIHWRDGSIMPGALTADGFDEDEHPRDEHGRFAPKEGGSEPAKRDREADIRNGVYVDLKPEEPAPAKEITKGWKSLDNNEAIAIERDILQHRYDFGINERAIIDEFRDEVVAEYHGPNNTLVMFGDEVSEAETVALLDRVTQLQDAFPAEGMVIRVDDQVAILGEHGPDYFPMGVGGLSTPGQPNIALNSFMYDEATKDAVKDAVDSGFKPASAWPNVAEASLVHEWSHAVFEEGMTGIAAREAVQAVTSEHPEIDVPGGYAGQSPAEAMAESFSDYVMTDGKTSDPFTQRMAELQGWDAALGLTAAAFEYDPDQPRDEKGQWTKDGGTSQAPTTGHTKATRAATDAMIEALKPDDGGFTIDPRNGSSPHIGYAVAYQGMSSITPAKEFFENPEHGRQVIKDFLRENAEFFDAHPDAMVGGWHDPVHQEIVLDPSRVVPSREEAIRLGTEQNQQSIADLGAIHRGDWDNAIIDTGGTGDREQVAASVSFDYGRTAEGPARSRAPPGQEDRRHDRRRTRRVRREGLHGDRVGPLQGFRVDLAALVAEIVGFDDEFESKHPRGPGGKFAPKDDGGDEQQRLFDDHQFETGGWVDVSKADAERMERERLRERFGNRSDLVEMVQEFRPPDIYRELRGRNGTVVMFSGEPKIAMEQAQPMLDTIDKLQQEFPRENMTIRVDDQILDLGDKAPEFWPYGVSGATAPGTPMININPISWDPEYRQKVLDYQAAGHPPMPMQQEVDPAAFTVAHEWGHTLDDPDGHISEGVMGKVADLDPDISPTSAYSYTSAAEAYADSFAEWVLSDHETDDTFTAYVAHFAGWEHAPVARTAAGEYDEDLHPRDERGRWTDKEGAADLAAPRAGWERVGPAQAEARAAAMLRAQGVPADHAANIAKEMTPDDMYASYAGPNGMTVMFTGDPNDVSENQQQHLLDVASYMQDTFPRENMTIRVDDVLHDTALHTYGVKIDGKPIDPAGTQIAEKMTGDYGASLAGSNVITLTPDAFSADYEQNFVDEAHLRLPPAAADSDPIEYTIVHEWGHTLDDTWHVRSETLGDMALDRWPKEIDRNVSSYAGQSAPEAYAENFAEWVLSGGRTESEVARFYAEHEDWAVPRATVRAAGDWDEEKHPRDERGRFAPIEGGDALLPPDNPYDRERFTPKEMLKGNPAPAETAQSEGWRRTDGVNVVTDEGRADAMQMLRDRGLDRETAAYLVEQIRPRDTYAEYEGPNGMHVIFTGTDHLTAESQERLLDAATKLQADNPRENMFIRVDKEFADPSFQRGVRGQWLDNALGMTIAGSNTITLNPKAFEGHEARQLAQNIRDGSAVPAGAGHDAIEYVATHEWGHTLDAPAHANSLDRFVEWQDSHDQKEPNISGYGSASNSQLIRVAETYAEAFAEWQLSDGKTTNEVARTYAEQEGWSRARTASVAFEFDPDQPRDEAGKWTKDGGGSSGERPSPKDLGDVYEHAKVTDPKRKDAERAEPVYKALGYDALPKVVTHDELEAAAKDSPVGILSRFVSTEAEAEDFRTGPLFVGQGWYGTGTYTYNGTRAAMPAYPARIDLTLTPDAKVATMSRETADNFASQHAEFGPMAHDPGAMFAAEGYDAVMIHAGPETYTLVLNRDKVIVAEKER